MQKLDREAPLKLKNSFGHRIIAVIQVEQFAANKLEILVLFAASDGDRLILNLGIRHTGRDSAMMKIVSKFYCACQSGFRIHLEYHFHFVP